MSNILKRTIIQIWDFLSSFFGFPYEVQANKLDVENIDPGLRDPINLKTSHISYTANKVSN